jgi:hypothetical protein
MRSNRSFSLAADLADPRHVLAISWINVKSRSGAGGMLGDAACILDRAGRKRPYRTTGIRR